MTINFLQVLRFSAKLHPSMDSEGDRTFILTYHVVDATLELTEKVTYKFVILTKVYSKIFC